MEGSKEEFNSWSNNLGENKILFPLMNLLYF